MSRLWPVSSSYSFFRSDGGDANLWRSISRLPPVKMDFLLLVPFLPFIFFLVDTFPDDGRSGEYEGFWASLPLAD